MKKISLLVFLATLFCSLCYAYPVGNPFPPFRIAGNLYYVGTDDLASFLVVTPRGNILINSDMEANVPMIKKSIDQLGFKFSDTKILLISHAHFDHAAGSQLILQDTNAKYMVMDRDVSLIESGGKTDFHYVNDKSIYFPKTKVDKVLHDGDQVKLGGTILTAHLTAGHTKGCTTWTMQVKEKGQKYDVAIVGSLNVNPGYKLIQNDRYPSIAEDYQHAIETLKELHCDIFLGAHAGYFNLKQKYYLINNNKNPFIDPEGYRNHIAQKEKEFYTELHKQKIKQKSAFQTSVNIKEQSKVIALVKKTATTIQKNGIEKSIIAFKNNSQDIFIGDYNGVFYVSPLHPEMIGKSQLHYKDPQGAYVVQEEVAKARTGGGWLKGRWRMDPVTKKYQCRKIYILPIADNYFIGSWYHYSPGKLKICVT